MQLTLPNSTIRDLSSARVTRTPGELEKAIIAEVGKLAPGKIGPDIDPQVVTKNHLAGKVAELRRKGRLTLDIGVVTTESGYALARYLEERVSPFAKWHKKEGEQPRRSSRRAA